MRRVVLSLLEARYSTLKAEWVQRIHLDHKNGGWADPSGLVSKMDSTLLHLRRVLIQCPQLHARPTLYESVKDCCQLYPLIAYFEAGESILIALIEQDQATDSKLREFVHSAWANVAQREFDSICAACAKSCARPYPPAQALIHPPYEIGRKLYLDDQPSS